LSVRKNVKKSAQGSPSKEGRREISLSPRGENRGKGTLSLARKAYLFSSEEKTKSISSEGWRSFPAKDAQNVGGKVGKKGKG